MVADWQLPPGVNRGLWDYFHDPAIARSYDAGLANCHLLNIDQEFALRHFPRPGRLLDLGCGTGRILIPFAQRGFWTVGVDLSTEMLKVAGEKAAAAGVVIQRVCANLVDLAGLSDGAFDHAACLFSTLGMVMGSASRRRVLEHVFRLLRPGGKFVLHVHNRWFNFWNRDTRRWLIKDCIRSLVGGSSAGDHVMPTHQGIAGLTLHLFTRREIVRLLRSVGFGIAEVKPISLRADGKLVWPFLFGRLRAYGYLLAVEKP
ncbi:MAG TPA: methyltransferase domain-containing protein [Gemmataceae bacterium]|nr:methyltransferase domain-containing protein [Gemmataceae bacterium]